MKPFTAALWIAKFVASLALLFAIPVVIFYGGLATFAVYENWSEQRAARIAKEQADEQAKHNAVVALWAVKQDIPAHDVCDLAVLNNGFSIRHRWREAVDAAKTTTRLGVGLGKDYVDIATIQIARFERDSGGCK